ncbi:secondary thiamine-phosphate synthase enzyme YjbQ [Reinekea marinisedimentorum]|uniref:Secondary thiamine-phosphate synthase enzyme n=1 Tax=Reinekea marinisedimentorum TaxID=230495 RepID=A0A4R3I8J6_9GAMM|nr:secondary thiamine-phosphate synthase enzyme YjbQ [Reinekea marinisedimentorum]TCS42592.1 secondary thiamine-phosphate synthase enzyme [Reinekea marinisedimentorum]
MWFQKQLILPSYERGFHLITIKVIEQLPEINQLNVGVLHLFLQHTSASISLNENADPTVRADLETASNRIAPEGHNLYLHDYEGMDDMPAHIKSAVYGVSLTIPIASGSLALGTWQGIVLGEHRNDAGRRRILATLNGE